MVRRKFVHDRLRLTFKRNTRKNGPLPGLDINVKIRRELKEISRRKDQRVQPVPLHEIAHHL
jgi:hypothetical protein